MGMVVEVVVEEVAVEQGVERKRPSFVTPSLADPCRGNHLMAWPLIYRYVVLRVWKAFFFHFSFVCARGFGTDLSLSLFLSLLVLERVREGVSTRISCSTLDSAFRLCATSQRFAKPIRFRVRGWRGRKRDRTERGREREGLSPFFSFLTLFCSPFFPQRSRLFS